MAHEFEVAICAIFRDEAPYLKEWIEYHRLVGVEHFILYNNLSQDHYQDVLAPYVEEGIVELIDWPFEHNLLDDWVHIQIHAYQDGAKRALKRIKWLAFIDIDEFIFPAKDGTIPQFLKDFKKEAAVAINWQLFGTSNIEKLETDKLMIEQLTCRAKQNYYMNHFVKTIAKVECIDLSPSSLKESKKPTGWNPHRPKLKKGLQIVDYNHEIVHNMRNPKKPSKRIRLHHYVTRDEETFQKKMIRKNQQNININKLTQRAQEYNEVLDTSILIHAEELRQRIFNDE